MANSYITDITHYLTEDGHLLSDLPAPALKLVNNFGKIISAASLDESGKNIVSCPKE